LTGASARQAGVRWDRPPSSDTCARNRSRIVPDTARAGICAAQSKSPASGRASCDSAHASSAAHVACHLLRTCRKTSAAVEVPSPQAVMAGEGLPSTDFASSGTASSGTASHGWSAGADHDVALRMRPRQRFGYFAAGPMAVERLRLEAARLTIDHGTLPRERAGPPSAKLRR
jgi:hypothetical protein